ncbi:MAG: T9SS type A sorting domain-containing protein [Bacteroidetes bacterium]|nr:T9SS type A sorting domain-containing protein [Bacteroidota bacterium]
MKTQHPPSSIWASMGNVITGTVAVFGLVLQTSAQTYCTAGASTPGAAGITLVSFNSINNSSSSSPAYSDFTSISTSVNPGQSYGLSVTITATGFFATNTARAWIDWNQDGTFAASEEYDLGTVTSGLGNVTDLTSNSPLNITVPLTATAGNTRMRIRTRRGTAPPACGNTNNSETEDYTINVVALPTCSGTPNPGNTTISDATPCPAGSFTLGTENPMIALGLTFQWQSSTSGPGGPYANNGLGTASTQITSATVPTWYRVNVTCSGNTGTSTPVLASPGLSASCYCTPTANSDDNTGLTNVTFHTLLNNSVGTPAYTDFSALSTTVTQGTAYPLSVLVNTDGNYTVYAKAWIDWDQNGTFDAGEAYDLGSVTNVANGAPSGSPVMVNVPMAALPGNTVMRVRATYSVAAVPCGNQNYSETEDYTVTVQAAVPCSGTPVPGNTTTDNATPCPGANFTLGTGNDMSQTGLTFQWQSSTTGAGGPFADNGLGTASTQVTNATVPTWYRVNATCSGNTGTSTPVLVTPTLSAACYCTVSANTDDNTGLTNVSFNTLNNSSVGAPAYTDFTALSTAVTQGNNYLLGVRVNTDGNYTVQVKAWIDWNANGTFEAGEEYNLGSATNVADAAPSGSPLPINVPMTSALGTIAMRVRVRYNSAPTACGNNNYSEAEDYGILVMPQHNTCTTAYPVQCGQTYSGSTTGVAHSMPATGCPFNGAASTGGQNWWTYTAAANEQVLISTCGNADFDTRISVFNGSDCNNLACLSMNDDYQGCAGGSSQASFNAVAGSTYWIAVHGAGATEGNYQISVICAPICAPPANDQCPAATAIAYGLADGSGVPALYTNQCATVDAPTSLSGTVPVEGVWFTFNSGAYSHALITLADNGTPPYTASTLNFAAYTGACSGLGAGNEAVAGTDAAGTNTIAVVPGTEYRLLVHNTGGTGVSGTFGLLVEHPAHSDAAITAINSPAPGLYCGSTMAPNATLLNNGDDNLTSVQITYGLSGGASHVYNWTGNLAYGQSANITLPTVAAEAGLGQTLTVATSLPNGLADEITTNDAAQISMDVGGEAVVVNIFTDNNAAGLGWQIYDEANNVVAQNGTMGNNTLVSENHCLPTNTGNCFQLYITDSYGDGLCCVNGNGYWELRTPAGGLLLRDLFDAGVDGFTSPTSTPATASYGFGHSFCLPPGPANIAANECGIFTNLQGNKVYCNKVTGATQYQFEFSDPDAGFLRRIVRTTNYVTFWDMVSNPLVPGVKYFARVRTNVAGPVASAHFGNGCDMGLAPLVPCSELIMAPNYGHSCNETRAFNPPTNNSFIYAKPVVGATEYQFRIYNLGEGYDQTFIRGTYILQLKWNNDVAPPLTNGSTYNVQMNVRVGGVYSGFCTSTCTITIDNGGNNEFAALEQSGFGTATLWPNPVRDGQVNLNITGLKHAEQQIEVQVLEVNGKPVFSHEFGNNGERFSTILQLPADLASGVYLVAITVNSVKTVHRLSIVR